MKFLYSFIKELKLASRGFYFYIELLMALLIVAVFLFAVPENFNQKKTEYIYLDMPTDLKKSYIQMLTKDQPNIIKEQVKIKINKEDKEVTEFHVQEKVITLLNNRQEAEYLAAKERKIVAIIHLDEQQELSYEYFLQGYESARFKNLLKILPMNPVENIETAIQKQDVRPLSSDFDVLSDKENILPMVLVLNGGLMGLFMIAAYIFLDRQEGVIKAYALTPSPVWQYLLSKIGVIIVTSIASSFIVVWPIMQNKPDYLLLLGLLISTTFFASSLGLYIASFYQNIMQSFGVFYALIMLMIVPNIAYFIPSWSPLWIKLIPSYYMLAGFKAALIGNNAWLSVISISLGFLISGFLIFLLANKRYKKILIN
ncbi:ABC transporter permease [Facklamia miroungae]|uniref:ABC-2 family transporter protein n=1 Tax=Facklamia miroungae TaxID=120956 RepID=A0A1G7UZ43_9LACT|nr:ABC transporter permease [Facklamia miroungae]NKZ30204.1 ABC transporter permease [Facklamia miroungae]SDG52744.1 ABC-2 family transporter protein [Facklamia miroungae]